MVQQYARLFVACLLVQQAAEIGASARSCTTARDATAATTFAPCIGPTGGSSIPGLRSMYLTLDA